ncbi:MAG: hypothetical protein QM228_07195 [Atribacterota bacterium]|nr:hypothetical protein [Atribacterota bacterium]
MNFFDAANVYSDGTSEEITGSTIKDYAKRQKSSLLHFLLVCLLYGGVETIIL